MQVWFVSASMKQSIEKQPISRKLRLHMKSLVLFPGFMVFMFFSFCQNEDFYKKIFQSPALSTTTRTSRSLHTWPQKQQRSEGGGEGERGVSFERRHSWLLQMPLASETGLERSEGWNREREEEHVCMCFYSACGQRRGWGGFEREYLLFRGRRGCSSDVKFLPLFSPRLTLKVRELRVCSLTTRIPAPQIKQSFNSRAKRRKQSFWLSDRLHRKTVTSSPFPNPEKRKKSRMFVREGGNRFPTPLSSSFFGGEI